MRLWCLLLLLPAVHGDCPPLDPVTKCNSATMFIFDASNLLSQNDVNEIMQYGYNNLLPKMAYSQGQEVAFLAYGASTVNTPITPIYNLLCDQFNDLLAKTQNYALQQVYLSQVLEKIANDYVNYMQPGFTIQLFSAEYDKDQIYNAADVVRTKMPGVNVTVIALSGKAELWKNFPYSRIIEAKPWELASKVATNECLLKSTCGSADACFATAPLPTQLPFSTTTPRNVNSPCTCNYQTSWNDVMLLFDNSVYTGSVRQQELWELAKAQLSLLNIHTDGHNETYYTRVGLAVFNYSDYNILYPLGKISGSQLQNIDRLPYYPSANTDIQKGLNGANSEFTKNGRPNAQHVTAIFASGYPFSNQISQYQYSDNNVLYQFIQDNDLGTRLGLIANGTARINSGQDNGHALVDALCDANCRCPQNYLPYLKDPQTKAPIGGCYKPFTSLSNLQTASNKCAQDRTDRPVTVAMGKTEDQNYFLANLYRNNTNFLAGMKWDSTNNGYFWLDGTSVNSSSYQPWYGGQSPQHLNGQDCVYVLNHWAPSQWSNLQQWVPNDCRNGFAYVCQTTVCDSTHYCY